MLVEMRQSSQLWLSLQLLMSSTCEGLNFAWECPKEIPFVIMTSDNTHACTSELLEANSYFWLKAAQIKLLKQVCDF